MGDYMKKSIALFLATFILACVISIPASAYEYDSKSFTATSFRKSWDTKKDIHLFTDYDVDCSGQFTYGFNTWWTNEDYCKFIIYNRFERYFFVNSNKGESDRSNWNSFYDATKIEIDHKKATSVTYGVYGRN